MSQFVRVNLGGILSNPNASRKIVEEENRNLAEELAKFGSERMKEYIRTRGTAFSAAARAAGINKGPGRIRTGNMYNSVDYRVEAGPNRVSAAFGWIRNFEDYFGYQETGFRNIWIASYTGSGKLRRGPDTPFSNGPIVRRNPYGGYKKTPGMFALRDARADAQAELPKLSRKYKARITRRLNSK